MHAKRKRAGGFARRYHPPNTENANKIAHTHSRGKCVERNKQANNFDQCFWKYTHITKINFDHICLRIN